MHGLRRSPPLITLAVLASLSSCASEEQGNDAAQPLAQEDGPRALAEQICASLFACACTTHSYADEATCINEQVAVIEPYIAAGKGWNEDCAGELLWTWQRWGCAPFEEALELAPRLYGVCSLFYGTIPAGETCEYDTQWYSPCARGLTCQDNLCAPAPALPVRVGERCWGLLPCEEGAYCHRGSEATYTCQPLPVLGDACDPGLNFDCGNTGELMCDIDSLTCQPAPGEGESCEETFTCGPELYCDGGLGLTCQPTRTLGEGCSTSAVCAGSASCVGNTCVADPALACNLVY
ncbi:hypothetical protein G6O69_00935 [Pseudenhygromyxa sp. WMMC2535]|uniref:hypothetical protein n=1 Tax=Pseudenhygromyxa sp. WMMC2535 TaxID=2712867 RepID=UPI00155313EB|nr:hypothetical protein [Pseudenhygromyxa sp. WMMC2535]NVB36375.1 hypothetical protein [Pseudenhygromyxa sp. WMMC2535]